MVTGHQDPAAVFLGLPDDVVATLVRWRPARTSAGDSALLETVLPEVRRWVAAAVPPDVAAARRMLRAVAAMTLWGCETFGFADERLLWQPRNVEWWVMVINADRSRHWRHNTRGVLRRVGRTVCPDDWPVVPRSAGRSSLPIPYNQRDEEAFRVAAGVAHRGDRAGRMWVVTASLGAGLLGSELGTSVAGDLVELGAGRLGVRISRSRNPRLVPFRMAYTDLVEQAVQVVEAAGGGRFVRSDRRNAVYDSALALAPRGGAGLMLRRARVTWLAAHVEAGTGLAVLRAIAGPVASCTLTGLMTDSAASLDPLDAAHQGLQI